MTDASFSDAGADPQAPASVVALAVSAVRDFGIAFVRRYHRLTVHTGPGAIDEPVLFVANHGFGGICDLNVFAAFAALEELELDRPVTVLTHQIAWTLKVGRFLEPIGARPAGRDSAGAAFAAGHHVLVLPGGDVEAGKSYIDRNRIVFSGRHGFARLAVEAGAPIVPLVTAGAGESLFVLSDGQWLARALRADKILRLKALPVSLSFPWGISVGVVGLLPYLPLPTKLDTAVLASMHPGADESHERFAGRVEAAMQDALTRLTEGRRLLFGRRELPETG